MPNIRCPPCAADLLELLDHLVFAVLGLLEHDLVELLDVVQALAAIRRCGCTSMQRMTSTMPCITISTPTIGISDLKGQTGGPIGLADECSFIIHDSLAKP